MWRAKRIPRHQPPPPHNPVSTPWAHHARLPSSLRTGRAYPFNPPKAFPNYRRLALISCRTSERTGAAPTGLAAAGAVFQTTLRTILRTTLRTILRITLRAALPGFLFQMLIRPRHRSQTSATAENVRASEMRWVVSERSDGFVCVHYEQDELTLSYRRQFVAR